MGIAATPTAKGYWVVTADGRVSAFGDAKFYGDLPDLGKHVSDVVAIAPTTDGQGYYLVGADGGFFTFGDAKFHGSLPGIHLRVKDVVGMVATPGGDGYLLGGVGRWRVHLRDHPLLRVAARPGQACARRAGHPAVLHRPGVHPRGCRRRRLQLRFGAKFHGSLPGERIRVSDIVGIALSPDNGGYLMAGTDGHGLWLR